jgi:hypothetical protein
MNCAGGSLRLPTAPPSCLSIFSTEVCIFVPFAHLPWYRVKRILVSIGILAPICVKLVQITAAIPTSFRIPHPPEEHPSLLHSSLRAFYVELEKAPHCVGSFVVPTVLISPTHPHFVQEHTNYGDFRVQMVRFNRRASSELCLSTFK